MDRFDTDPLPDDDRDLALARSLDAASGEAAQPAVGGDPLARALAQDRADRTATPAPSPARVDALRARVLAATAPEETVPAPRTDRAARPPVRTRRRAFAVAMAVLVPLALVATAVLIWPRAPEATLLASAAGPSPVTAMLPGGDGRVVLDPGARLDALPSTDGVVRVRLTGSATFDVTHRPERRFEVEVGGATVAVLGTRFRVTGADGRVAVVLERGRVRLSSAGGDAVTLAPGETATATATAVTAPKPADAVVADTDTDLSFRRSPARAVADALAARFGVVVRLPEDVAAETVTGTLVLGGDTPDAALDAFGEVLGGRFVPDGGGRAYRFERSR